MVGVPFGGERGAAEPGERGLFAALMREVQDKLSLPTALLSFEREERWIGIAVASILDAIASFSNPRT